MATSASDQEVNSFLDKLSSKKTKEKYKLIETFGNYLFPQSGSPPKLSTDSISFIIDGDYDKKLTGLCQICGKKKISKKLKRSSIAALELIHKLLYEHPQAKIAKKLFKSVDPDVYLIMNLGKHFLAKHNKKDSNKSIDIIKFIRAERPKLALEEFVMKEESYAKLDIILKDFMADPEQQKKYFIEQLVEEPTSIIEDTEDIKVEDDIENNGVYLKEPTTWAEVDEDDDELFDFLKDDKEVLDDEQTDDINFSNQIVPENVLGKSMLETYNRKAQQLDNFEVFDQASTTIEKSVKSFLNQEYIGESETFDANTLRPFLKTKNVLEGIYKSLFKPRGHGTVESVAKSSTIEINDKFNLLKEKVDIIIEPLKAKLKDLESIKRAEEAFILEQKTVFYLDQNLADPNGNKEKTTANVRKAINQVKSKIENANVEYLDTEDGASSSAVLTNLYTFLNDGDTATGNEKACDVMIDALKSRIVNSLQSMNANDDDIILT